MASPVADPPRPVLLDACCIINLLATERIEEVLAALPHRFFVARYVVEREVLRIEASPGSVVEPPSLETLAERGVLGIEEPSTELELRQLVRFAAVLDDGEAHTCALAIARQGIVATDDAKALRLLATEAVATMRTSELVQRWAETLKPPPETIRQVVRRVRERARFVPPRNDPGFAWWTGWF